jgi:hypothetical protein
MHGYPPAAQEADKGLQGSLKMSSSLPKLHISHSKKCVSIIGSANLG